MTGFLKGWLLTVVAGSLVIVAVLGGVFYLLSRPSPLVTEPGITAGPDSTTPTPNPQAAQELEARLLALTEGQHTVLRMQMSQEEINSMLTRNLPLIQQKLQDRVVPFRVEGLKVVLEPDRLLVVSRIEAFGFHPTVSMAARPSVHDGQPRMGIEKLYLGRIPLPGLVKDWLDLLLAQELEQLPLQDLSLELRHILVGQGKLIVEGIIR
jgi:hypothetical protein